VATAEPEFLEGDAWSIGAGGGGNVLPPANCIVVGWRTSGGGRRGRGRTFLGPLDSILLEANGGVVDLELTAIRDAAAALVDASDSFNDGALGVFSPTGNLFRDFVSSAVRDQFAVLRSRRD
jgi:hypothetical protein